MLTGPDKWIILQSLVCLECMCFSMLSQIQHVFGLLLGWYAKNPHQMWVSSALFPRFFKVKLTLANANYAMAIRADGKGQTISLPIWTNMATSTSPKALSCNFYFIWFVNCSLFLSQQLECRSKLQCAKHMGLYSTLNLTSGETMKEVLQSTVHQSDRAHDVSLTCLACFFKFLLNFSSTLLCGRLHTPSGENSTLSDEQKECCWHSKCFRKPHKGFYKTWLSLHFVRKAQILIGTDVIVFPFKIFFSWSQVVPSICSYQW